MNDARNGAAAAAAPSTFAIVDIEARALVIGVASAGRASDDGTDRREQRSRGRHRERGRAGPRINFRSPQRFGRIDVAQASDDSLVQ